MTNKHVKGCLASLVIREMQVRIPGYPHSHVMAKIIKTGHTGVCEDMEKTPLLVGMGDGATTLENTINSTKGPKHGKQLPQPL